MRESILTAFPKTDVHVAIVWMQMPGFRDNVASARRAAARLNDRRVHHFYDPHPGHVAGRAFSAVTLPDGKVAWDIYMNFDGEAVWKKDGPPPRPYTFRHQLGRLRAERHFRTGEALAGDLHAVMHELTNEACVPTEAKSE